MKAKALSAAMLWGLLCTSEAALAGDWMFGIGLQAGVSRLEGDTNQANLSPMVSGHLRILPIPYFAINGELGFSPLGYSGTNAKTAIMPFEISGMLNFLPFKKINPYIFLGGGGVYFDITNVPGTNGKVDSFLKTGAGVEYRVSPTIGVNLGASFRYSLTDGLELTFSGDENDQVLDVHAGFTYYFSKRKGDRDRDMIPDELDLMPEIAEDRDGYLDHDGIPEKNPSPAALNSFDTPQDSNGETPSPIVIHQLVTRAESNSNVPIKAYIYSNIDLRVVATLYRPIGTSNWNVVRMDDHGGNLYQTLIPGYAVTSAGLQYCVVAVDETLGGIGYSGLPSKPISVEVLASGKPWRIVGGILGAAAVGSASYIVIRKQN
jgi:hypothetical protein